MRDTAIGLLALAVCLCTTTAEATDAGPSDASSFDDAGSDAGDAGIRITARSRLDDALAADREGHSAEALRVAREALERSWVSHDEDTEAAARKAIAEIRTHVATVWFAVPEDAKDLSVEFDGRHVVDARGKKRYWVDPGDHMAVADAMLNGEPHRYEEHIVLKAGENRLIDVKLVKQEVLCSICEDYSPCMRDAKSESDVKRCLAAQRGCGGCASTHDASTADGLALAIVALAACSWRRRERRGSITR